jgi:hypothetical protein
MAYVPEMNEYEDFGLGIIKPMQNTTAYKYIIKGKLVNKTTFYDELKKIYKANPQLEPIDKRLGELYQAYKEMQNLEEEKRKLKDKIAKENNFEIIKVYFNNKGKVIKEEKIF